MLRLSGSVNLHDQTGINVPVCNASALAEAINGLLESPDSMEGFRKRCRERYNSFFSMEKMVDAVYALYQDVLA